MLVLSRKQNEKIVINHNISVMIVEIRGNTVRLGIEAPPEIPVHRQEVEAAIQREGANARRPGDAAPPPVVAGVVTPAEAACDYAADDDAA